MTMDWRIELAAHRKRLGLSRKSLAALAGVSEPLVKAYEAGIRDSTRESLNALLAAMALDRGTRSSIMVAAGFAPDGLDHRPANIGEWWLTPDEAKVEIESYPWPAFVLTERVEVLHANLAAQWLWGVDLGVEYEDPVERNLLSVATTPRFADRVANWDECIGEIVHAFKGFTGVQEEFTNPSPYFAAVLQRFVAGDPKYAGRFATIWETVSAAPTERIRWTYPVVWDEPGIGKMTFRATVSTLNENDGLAVNDWIPVGSDSWRNLEQLRATLPQRRFF